MTIWILTSLRLGRCVVVNASITEVRQTFGTLQGISQEVLTSEASRALKLIWYRTRIYDALVF